MKRFRLSGAALAVVALSAAMVASAAYGITTVGVQGQLDFRSCVSGTGAGGCALVNNALGQPTAMGLSADESRLFVVSHGTDAVAAFVRDRGTGGLQPLKTNSIPCTTETGAGGTNGTVCADGHGLDGPTDVSAGGSTAYIVSDGSDALAVLTKDSSTGAWKQLNNDPGHNLFYCLAATTADGCQASSVPQTLVDPASVASAPGRVYVGGPGSIAVFSSSTKGALRQLSGEVGCVTDGAVTGCATAPFGIPGTVVNMAISRDGRNLYAVTDADRLLVFGKGTTGALIQRQTLAVPNVSGLVGVAVDAGSKATSVYVAGTNGIGVFRRDKSDGTLSQPGGLGTPQVCINAAGTGGCTAAPNLAQIGSLIGIAVYKTNRFAYAAGTGGLASFARSKTTVALTPLAGSAACTTNTGNGGACLAGLGIGGLTDIQTTSTKHEYVAGTSFNSVVATHLGG